MHRLADSYITIAIPFYSNLDYLKVAVASVLEQSCSAWRLIVVDDHGPLVGVEQYLEGLADERIKYVRNQSNLGLGGNWNRCLDLADSDLVTILHADDALEPEYVKEMLKTAQSFPSASALFCKAMIIDHQGKATTTVADTVKNFLTPNQQFPTTLQGESALATLLKGNYIVCPTLCYRLSKLGCNRFSTDLQMVLDFEFTTRLLLADHNLVSLPLTLYRYRRHCSNTTTKLSQSLTRTREEAWLWSHLDRCCYDRAWLKASRTARKKTIIKLTLGYLIVNDLLGIRLSAAWQKALFLPSLWQPTITPKA